MDKPKRIVVVAVLILLILAFGIRIPDTFRPTSSVPPYTPPPAVPVPEDAGPAPPGTGPDGLFATWAAVFLEGFGKKASGSREAGMWLTFTPEKVVWTFDTPKGRKAYDALYHIEPAKSPKEIDLGQPAQLVPGNLLRGVYKVEDDKLTILGGIVRPKTFSDVPLIRLELKRVRFPSS
jgi:uncharacterized protein (TIGR03067 family)